MGISQAYLATVRSLRIVNGKAAVKQAIKILATVGKEMMVLLPAIGTQQGCFPFQLVRIDYLDPILVGLS